MFGLKEPKVEIRSDYTQILSVYKKLRYQFGFFTGARYMHCAQCAWTAVEDRISTQNIVFWTQVEHIRAFKVADDGSFQLKTYLPLYWSGDARAIIDTFEEAGFATYWDGEADSCIYIMTQEIAANQVA